MDPQMVWDMMDEEENVDTHTTLCQSIEPEVEAASFRDAPKKNVSTGWMGFPVYGMRR